MSYRPRAQARGRRRPEDDRAMAQAKPLDTLLGADDRIDRHLHSMAELGPEEYGYPMACASIIDRVYDPYAPIGRVCEYVEQGLLKRGGKPDHVEYAMKELDDAFHIKFRQYLCQTATNADRCLQTIDTLVGLARSKFGLVPTKPIQFQSHQVLNGVAYANDDNVQYHNHERTTSYDISVDAGEKRVQNDGQDFRDKRQKTREATTMINAIELDYERLPPSASEMPPDRPISSQRDTFMRDDAGGATNDNQGHHDRSDSQQGLAIRGAAARKDADASSERPSDSRVNQTETDPRGARDSRRPAWDDSGAHNDAWADSADKKPTGSWADEPVSGNGWADTNVSGSWGAENVTGQWNDGDAQMVDSDTPSSRRQPPSAAPTSPRQRKERSRSPRKDHGDRPEEPPKDDGDWAAENVSGAGKWVDTTVPDPADEGFHEPKDVEIWTWDDRPQGGGWGGGGGRGRGRGDRFDGPPRGGRGGRGGRGAFRGGRDDGYDRRDFGNRDEHRGPARGPRDDFRGPPPRDNFRGPPPRDDFRGPPPHGDPYSDPRDRRDFGPPPSPRGRGAGRGGPGGRGGRPCRYFNTPGGCRQGEKCPFPHVREDDRGPDSYNGGGRRDEPPPYYRGPSREDSMQMEGSQRGSSRPYTVRDCEQPF